MEPHTRTGRPPIGPEVKTRITDTEIEELERRAALAGIHRSELIRQYIRAGLAQPPTGSRQQQPAREKTP